MGGVSGLGSDSIISMAYDEYTQTLVVGHPENGVSLVNSSTISLIQPMTLVTDWTQI